MKRKKHRTPWAWVPSVNFAEGIPYFIVNTISVIMFKNMGMDNADVALLTSLLYLPWVIKPFWSPFVDIIKTKRWWIVAMQITVTLSLAAAALLLPGARIIAEIGATSSVFLPILAIFYLTAFASATHDIAADGLYMLALSDHEQSLFVGIRSTFYRLASIFGQGVLVVVAGILEQKMDSIPAAWRTMLIICSVFFALVTIYHIYVLPKVEIGTSSNLKAKDIFHEFGESFRTFFTKKGIVIALVFMLLYRLPEALLVKMLNPFLLDSLPDGGLALSTAQVGLVYGTIGVAALTLGGIVGGIVAAKKGLKACLLPMAAALTLPCFAFVVLAATQTSNFLLINCCVAIDQFGYGFGFTAYMLYLIFYSKGEWETSHYSICTAFMALSMMIPGLFAGYLQKALGYELFFYLVMACCIVTFIVTLAIRKHIPSDYGKK